jgi:hypothetical protein
VAVSGNAPVSWLEHKQGLGWPIGSQIRESRPIPTVTGQSPWNTMMMAKRIAGIVGRGCLRRRVILPQVLLGLESESPFSPGRPVTAGI